MKVQVRKLTKAERIHQTADLIAHGVVIAIKCKDMPMNDRVLLLRLAGFEDPWGYLEWRDSFGVEKKEEAPAEASTLSEQKS